MQPTRPNSNNVGAFVLIGLGALFLLAQLTGWSFFGMAWPLIVAAPGLAFLGAAYFGDSKQAGFFVPGMVITGTGAILWYQNMTGNWHTWSYAWALYPVFVGIALSLMGKRTGQEKQIKEGRDVLRTGLLLFLGFAAFFELFIFNDFGGLWSIALPVALIIIGIVMLRGGRISMPYFTSDDKAKNDEIVNANGARKIAPVASTLQEQIDAALADEIPQDQPAPRA